MKNNHLGIKSICALLCTALLIAAGCASTKTSDRKQFSSDKIPQPKCIWVYDFAATATDLPVNSAITDLVPKKPGHQTSGHIRHGRKVGALLAEALTDNIKETGIKAKHATDASPIEINDIILCGYIISHDDGDEKKRTWVGFGQGATHLQVAVEGFQFTGKGLRKLGYGKMNADGSKAPGGVASVASMLATKNPLGLIISSSMKKEHENDGSSKVEGRARDTAKEIAKLLKKRFQEQGWIKE